MQRHAPAVLLLAALLCACEGGAPARPEPTPYTGEQLDRIAAGLRARGERERIDPAEEPPPTWVSTELLDDRTRLVIHVRFALSGDLEDDARHQTRCARTKEQIRELLLPGQTLEMYLVFDTGVHACKGDADPATNPG